MTYDCIIIGAGMSGLAAGIRLSMYNKKILIVEKHTITGGLNSYYNRGKRKFDVGLHALTNFVQKDERGKPFNKLMKQLRIPYEEFKLSPQKHSLIKFPEHTLKFTNNINELIENIHQTFPSEIDGFLKLLEVIKNFDEVNLNNETIMAKTVVSEYIKDERLSEMIFCPLLIYGSAWENDMDFSQFVIMFKSIFLEGFSRPEGGVRTIIDLLLKKLHDNGVDIQFKKEVTKIITKDKKVVGVELNHGETVFAHKIISSIGLPETFKVTSDIALSSPAVGKMSFCESIFITKEKPIDLGIDSTIIFYNNRPQYLYQQSKDYFDPESAVLCFPNNFDYSSKYQDDYEEGVLRVTNIARFDWWEKLRNEDKKKYLEQKDLCGQNALTILQKNGLSPATEVVFKDIFTPATIKRYTQHIDGTVYGSTDKSRNGKTLIEGLFICGTDQGFLGIVGSMLSGISMSNLHVLQDYSIENRGSGLSL